MGFSEELVKNRKVANMTQEELAERCNVSRQAVAKWEKGDSLPDVYLIAKLAGMFNVTIEELIWSRDTAVIENKNYYVREIEETDKKDFGLIMREHRYFGGLLKLIEKMDNNSSTDEIYYNYLNEGKTYILRSKDNNDFVGYIYLEALETHAPQMTMQFDKHKKFEQSDFVIIRDFFNWVSKEYHIRAIQAFVNSDLERALFAYMGYENAKDEIMLALPV